MECIHTSPLLVKSVVKDHPNSKKCRHTHPKFPEMQPYHCQGINS